MEPVAVWRGAYGDPVPLFGPLPGVRSGQVIAYEFALPERFEPRPGRTRLHLTDRGAEVIARDLYIDVMIPTDGRHQRLLDLDEFAEAIEAGDLPADVAIDGLRRWQRFLDQHVHRDRDPSARWPDFPPQAIESLAALPAPLGPVVTWRG